MKKELVSSEKELEALLSEMVAPAFLALWGKMDYKGIDNLYLELRNHDMVLKKEKCELRRLVKAVFVDVVYMNKGIRYVLREDRQEFPDGRVRRRILLASAGEKANIGESFERAAQRLIAEEMQNIGLDVNSSRLKRSTNGKKK